MDIYNQIIQKAEQLEPEMTVLRRDFHKYAETGWLEMRTSSLIAAYLTRLGYEVLTGEDVCLKEARMGVPSQQVLDQAYQRAIEQGADPDFVAATKDGMTGVIGILRCGEGPCVAMRFDIDALGVIECDAQEHIPVKEGFASVNKGAMHACGHDAHTCVGLGVAATLMEIRDHLHGTVKLIFQPAEEGVRGAKSIVEKGHLDGVQYLLASHITNSTKENSDVAPGAYGSLATSKYDALFHGKAGHAGAAPHSGANALMAAATALLNLQAIPRHGGGATRINVGKLVGGTGRNVIPDEALLEIEVRGATTELNDYMAQQTVQVLEAAAAMHGCTVDICLVGSATSVNSDKELATRIGLVCRDMGQKVSADVMVKSGGSEDFGYMANKVQENGGQAVFMRIYTPLAGPAHDRTFDFNESYIPKGIKVFCGAVYDLMK